MILKTMKIYVKIYNRWKLVNELTSTEEISNERYSQIIKAHQRKKENLISRLLLGRSHLVFEKENKCKKIVCYSPDKKRKTIFSFEDVNNLQNIRTIK